MLKITGSIPMAHAMNYRAIEEAVEVYVEKAANYMLSDWTTHASEDRPAIEFFSSCNLSEVGVEIDLQAFVDCAVDNGMDYDTAKIWHDFFAQSAARLEQFLDEEGDA